MMNIFHEISCSFITIKFFLLLTIIGIIWVICPVISKTMTDTEIVCVTAPEKAAAPTAAYPPLAKYCYFFSNLKASHN